jgi:hypothetical protein
MNSITPLKIITKVFKFLKKFIMSFPNECPICMEEIIGQNNKVVTECGHTFHCSCLMQNASHNGFGCPYCRFKLAEELENDEEEDDEDEEWVEDDENENYSIFGEEALTSFRMFHQRLNGEEVEEEIESGSTFSENLEEEDSLLIPHADYISEKLLARGISFEDLVKNILFLEHSNFGEFYGNYERRSSQVYGQFRAVITQYKPPENDSVISNISEIPHLINDQDLISRSTNVNLESIELPSIAEPKSLKEYKHRVIS